MINININSLDAFYLTVAIIGLGFAIMVTFGKTEEPARKSRRTTTS